MVLQPLLSATCKYKPVRFRTAYGRITQPNAALLSKGETRWRRVFRTEPFCVRNWAHEILPDRNLRRIQPRVVLPAKAERMVFRPDGPRHASYNSSYNALSRYLKDFLRWLDLGAPMQEVGKRLRSLLFGLAEITRTSEQLISDSAALCEASRTLCQRSEQQRTALRQQRTAMRLYHQSPRLRVHRFSPID